jgi:hypothetical protein
LKSGVFERRMTFVMIKNLQNLFLGACLILLAVNVYQLAAALAPERPILFGGIKFAGLHEILKNETRVGYLTDLSIDDTGNLAEYQQAQLMLAPSVLEINNPNTKFLIVNCSSDTVAYQKLKELGIQPLKRNQFGIILAFNPRLYQP